MSPLAWFDLRLSHITFRPTTSVSEVRVRNSSRNPDGRLIVAISVAPRAKSSKRLGISESCRRPGVFT